MKLEEKIYIFVSHSHLDIEKVRVLRNYLESICTEPILFFLKSLDDKDAITTLIKDEIDARVWFIYCDSENARASEWVKTELEHVKNTNKENFLTIDLEKDFDGFTLKKKTKDKINVSLTDISCLSQLFVSYSHIDSGYVNKVINQLNDYGIKTLSHNQLLIGTAHDNPYLFDINNEVKKSPICLVFISESSKKSKFCLQEQETILQSDKTVIPVLLNCDKSNENRLEWYDFKRCIRADCMEPEQCASAILYELMKTMSRYEDYFLDKLNLISPTQYSEKKCYDAVDLKGNRYNFKIIRRKLFTSSNTCIITFSLNDLEYSHYFILISCLTAFQIDFAYKIPNHIIRELLTSDFVKKKGNSYTLPLNENTLNILKQYCRNERIENILNKLK